MEDSYRTLGWKTLMVFVLERIQASFILLLLAVALFAIEGQSFLGQLRSQVPDLDIYINFAAWGVLILFLLFSVISFFIAWLIYINYKFFLDEDSLKISRGILNKEEIAIPYRQIQDVDINRDLSFRMLGVSRIVILTAGHEDQPRTAESGESEGFLPALDRDLAEWLREELLKRTNVQKVTQVAS